MVEMGTMAKVGKMDTLVKERQTRFQHWWNGENG